MDRLWLRSRSLRVKRPDRTGLSNTKYCEGMDGTEQTQKSTKGCNLGTFRAEFEIMATQHEVAQLELPVWACSN